MDNAHPAVVGDFLIKGPAGYASNSAIKMLNATYAEVRGVRGYGGNYALLDLDHCYGFDVSMSPIEGNHRVRNDAR